MGTLFIRSKLYLLFLLTVSGAAAISAFLAFSSLLEAQAVPGGDGDETPCASRQTSGAVRITETGQQHAQGRRSPHSGDEDRDPGHPRTTTYLYDGDDIIAEYDGRNQLTRSYLHGAGIDEPLSVTKIGKNGKRDVPDTYYYNADGSGTITGITDGSGHLVQRYEYDSFGNIRHHGHRIEQPFTYTGRGYDHETGLYFYRGRYYDPEIGRFINRDPIGFVGGDTNLYAYVGNNPINWGDPSGLWRDDLHSGIGYSSYGTYLWATQEGSPSMRRGPLPWQLLAL